MKTIPLMVVLVVSATANCFAQQFTPPALPPGTKSRGENFQADIIKVYSLDDQGSAFRAYVVKYKGSEVVVQDTMGQSSKKVGDKITVVAARVEVPMGGTTLKTISFRVLPFDVPIKK